MSQIVSRNPVTNGKDDRSDAWIISCDVWDTQSRPGLILPINPESLEVRLPITGVESTMYGGKFIVKRRDPRAHTTFDYPSIPLRFNSGNITPQFNQAEIENVQLSNLSSSASMAQAWNRTHPMAADPKPNAASKSNNLYGRYEYARSTKTGPGTTPGIYAGLPEIPVGVQNLYALLSLLNETWIMNASVIDTGVNVGMGAKQYTQLNRIRVSTSNLVFPGLVLYGFFDESGVQWSESADNPTNFDVSLNLIVTHSTPRLRGVDLQALISAYKSLYTARTTFDAEYNIGYQRYPDSGTCLDPIPDQPATAQQPPKSWADRINEFSTAWFGNGREGGAVRTAIGSGVGVSTSAADRYADRALQAVDPVYAAKVKANRAQAVKDTDAANASNKNAG